MKTLFSALLTFAALGASPALSAVVYTANSDDLSIVSRFTDVVYDHVDGKNVAREFCYLGQVKDVCTSVQKDSLAAIEEYTNGAHDAFEVESCTADKNAVKVVYRMFSDYTDDVTKDAFITSCGDVSEKAEATIFQTTFGEFGSQLHVGTYRGGVDTGRTSLCFEGKAEAVCAQISQDLALTLEEYKEGAHNYQELKSCVYDAKKGSVEAAFTLFHDWDAEPRDVTHTLDVCLK